jgi:hypothetical protein
MSESTNPELSRMIIRLQAGVLAVVCAVIGGLGLFIMTAWLVIKGGRTVGPHLRLLDQYLVGYSVTWRGSFIGLVYGALLGAIVGWTIGTIYNMVAGARHKNR